MVKITCIIVLYNPDVENLQKQLRVLAKQVTEIVLVDNSAKANNQYLGHYIANCKNVGVAAAQNQGIKWALSEKCTHVLIMDQDSLLADDAVAKLLVAEKQLLNKNVKLGAVGPVFVDIRKQNECCVKSGYIKAKQLISSGTLIRAEVLRDIGLMNEWLFIDGVDDEWCFRALHKGYRFFQVCDVKMVHELGQVRKLFGGKICFNYHQPFRYYYMFRNYIYLLKQKHVPFSMRCRYAYTLIKLLGKVIFLPHKSDYFKQASRGIVDGCKA